MWPTRKASTADGDGGTVAQTGATTSITSNNLQITGPTAIGAGTALPLVVQVTDLTFNSAGAVAIRVASGVQLTGSNTAGSLTVTATTGDITDSGTTTVGGNATFTTSAAGADILLDLLQVDGTIALHTNGVGGDATITNDAGINFAASTIGGNLTATATTGDITDAGAVAVGGNASFTTVAAGADIDLNLLQVDGTIALHTNGLGGDATITNDATINFAASTIGGSLTATATTGDITDAGVVAVGGNASFTTVAAGADIDLNLLQVDGTIALHTNGLGGDATITNDAAINFAASTIGGSLTATATTGDITDAGVVAVGVNASFTTVAAGADIVLDLLQVDGTIALHTNGAGRRRDDHERRRDQLRGEHDRRQPDGDGHDGRHHGRRSGRGGRQCQFHDGGGGCGHRLGPPPSRRDDRASHQRRWAATRRSRTTPRSTSRRARSAAA